LKNNTKEKKFKRPPKKIDSPDIRFPILDDYRSRSQQSEKYDLIQERGPIEVVTYRQLADRELLVAVMQSELSS
jgi:hypothetical protein